jgi:hypothetical protein
MEAEAMTESPNYLGLPNLRYQLVTGLVVGQWCLPPAQIIDTSRQEFAWLFNVPPPLDAVALNQATYDFMVSNGQVGLSYPYWLVRYASGINPIHP